MTCCKLKQPSCSEENKSTVKYQYARCDVCHSVYATADLSAEHATGHFAFTKGDWVGGYNPERKCIYYCSGKSFLLSIHCSLF